MKNIAIASSNHRFNKVQEELKSLLSIIMGVVEESSKEEQDFEYFNQNATSQEELTQIEELKKSTQKLNRDAEIYQNGIGLATRKVQRGTSRKTTTNEPIIFNEIKPISTKSTENIRHIDDFSNER